MKKYFSYLILFLLLLLIYNDILNKYTKYNLEYAKLNEYTKKEKDIQNEINDLILKIKNKRNELNKIIEKNKSDYSKLDDFCFVDEKQVKLTILDLVNKSSLNLNSIIFNRNIYVYYNYSFNDVTLELSGDIDNLIVFLDYLYTSSYYFDTSNISMNLVPDKYIINFSFIIKE